MNTQLTYQQTRFLEEVSRARREGLNFLVTSADTDNVAACCKYGFLDVQDGVAKLTEAGRLYIFELNSELSANLKTINGNTSFD